MGSAGFRTYGGLHWSPAALLGFFHGGNQHSAETNNYEKSRITSLLLAQKPYVIECVRYDIADENIRKRGDQSGQNKRLDANM
jgi:hypothetical protein